MPVRLIVSQYPIGLLDVDESALASAYAQTFLSDEVVASQQIQYIRPERVLDESVDLPIRILR